MPLTLIQSISAKRLRVRPIAEQDLTDIFAINSDPEVTHFLPYPNWATPDDGAAWFKRMQTLSASGTAQQLVIEHNTDKKVIGTILLFKFDEASARVELGYVLGRAHWGQGLMHEALLAICSHAFSNMSIRRIEAEVNPTNVPSNKLLQRIGFTLEGTLRKRWMAKGVAYDTNVYGLLADEWSENIIS
jgi:[ribosomal protein S5]-alanine N-acetyltransferase